MEKIKKYFRNLLIALATTILASFAVTTNNIKESELVEESDDFHMFI